MANFYKFESGEKGREILQRLGYKVPQTWCVTPSEVPENYPRHTEPDNRNPLSMAYLGENGRLILTSLRDPVLIKSQGKLESVLDELEIPSEQ